MWDSGDVGSYIAIYFALFNTVIMKFDLHDKNSLVSFWTSFAA